MTAVDRELRTHDVRVGMSIYTVSTWMESGMVAWSTWHTLGGMAPNRYVAIEHAREALRKHEAEENARINAMPEVQVRPVLVSIPASETAATLIERALLALSTTKGRAAVDNRGLEHARRLLESAAAMVRVEAT